MFFSFDDDSLGKLIKYRWQGSKREIEGRVGVCDIANFGIDPIRINTGPVSPIRYRF